MFPFTPSMLPKKTRFGAPHDGQGPDATVPLSCKAAARNTKKTDGKKKIDNT